MDKIEVLSYIKVMMGIEGTYHDKTLLYYIDEVLNYMQSAGVNLDLLKTETHWGIIARGVLDLWNYSAGIPKWSNYFFQRLSQLVMESQKDGV